MKKTIFYYLVLMLILVSFGSCGGGGGSGGGNSPTPPQNGEGAGVIGPEGGTIEVTDHNSQLFGIKLVVPAGALNEEKALSIKPLITNYPVPDGFDDSGVQIELEPSGIIFEKPIDIFIPSGGNSSALYYVYNEQLSSWIVLDTEYDENIDAFKVSIDHFSVISKLCFIFESCKQYKTCSVLTYSIYPITNNAPGYTSREIHNAIVRAFNAWENALDGKLKFIEGNINSDIFVSWEDSYIFKSLIYHSKALAITRVLDPSGAKWISFNDTGKFTFTPDKMDLDNTKYNIETIALHEIGHALGLNHYSCLDDSCINCYNGPIMAPKSDPMVSICGLQQSDIERINDLYDDVDSCDSFDYNPSDFCSGWTTCDGLETSGPGHLQCQTNVYKTNTGSLLVSRDNLCWKTLPTALKGNVEFTAWALPAQDDDTNFSVYFGSSTGTRQAFGIHMNETNNWNTPPDGTYIATYSKNWTKIRIVANTDANTYSVYFDGVIAVENKSITTPSAVANGIDLIGVSSGRGGSAHDSYIDDIRMRELD